MTAYTHECPPDDCGPCGALPSGFVRLRYFYGKRLNVVDFVDEQRYHATKNRFHNQRLHGAGVLCGLAARPFGAGSPTLLRVTKGAALDECGREIVVGYDQCIDVEAWYVRWRTENLAADPAWKPPTDKTILRLCVAIRFRECPSGIEPAPRDPCACDATGNDYGRVREEFDLELLVHTDAMTHVPPAITPPHPGLDRELARALGGGDLDERLRALLNAGCPEAESDDWLVLACFGAVLDTAREHVVKLEQIEATATMLYASALIQALGARTMGATLEAGAWATNAPEIDAIGFVVGDPAGTTPVAKLDRVVVTLTAPVVAHTANNAQYELRKLGSAQWEAPGSVTALYDPGAATAPARIAIAPTAGFFVAGGLYRLSIVTKPGEPIVDDMLRPLVPLRPSFHFKIVDNAGTLEYAHAPYAEASP